LSDWIDYLTQIANMPAIWYDIWTWFIKWL